VNTATTTLILSVTNDPLRQACAGFLARYGGPTLESYRIHLDLWLRWCTQVGLDPLQVRRPHVEIWLRSLEDQNLASATRAAKFGVVHLFYKYAVVDEITDRDPTENVTRPKVHEGEQKRTWLPTLDSSPCWMRRSRQDPASTSSSSCSGRWRCASGRCAP